MSSGGLGTVAPDLGFNDGAQEYREWLWWIRIHFAVGVVTAA